MRLVQFLLVGQTESEATSELNFFYPYIYFASYTDNTHAVQHVLTALGYGSTSSKPGDKTGDKSGGPGMVAMEMEPEDVQWIKVRFSYSI